MLVDGEPIAARHVMAGRTSGEVLDRSMGGDLDILSLVRPMRLRPEASTITYTNFGTPQGSIFRATDIRSDDLTNDLARTPLNLLFLPGQYLALASQVNPLLSLGGVPTLPPIDVPSFPDPPLFRSFFDRFVIQLPGGRDLPGGVTDAFWAAPVPSIGEDPRSGRSYLTASTTSLVCRTHSLAPRFPT